MNHHSHAWGGHMSQIAQTAKRNQTNRQIDAALAPLRERWSDERRIEKASADLHELIGDDAYDAWLAEVPDTFTADLFCKLAEDRMIETPRPTDTPEIKNLLRALESAKTAERGARLRYECYIDGPEKDAADADALIAYFDLQAARKAVRDAREQLTEQDIDAAGDRAEIANMRMGR